MKRTQPQKFLIFVVPFYNYVLPFFAVGFLLMIFISFFDYRILRNKSVYQAEKISIDKCSEAIKFAKLILPEIKRKFEGLYRK